MKSIFTLFLFVAVALSSFAQDLSKEETKKVKKELKSYMKNPESYVRKIEKYDTEIEAMETAIETKSEEIADQEVTITELNDGMSELKTELAEAKVELTKMEDKTSNCKDFPEGSTYRVQIGVYEKFSITEYLNALKFVMYESVDGMTRYSVGNFDNPKEAKALRTDLKKMGIKDAFITEYVNGNRNTEFDEEDLD